MFFFSLKKLRFSVSEGVWSCFCFILEKKNLDMRDCITVHLYRVLHISKELSDSWVTTIDPLLSTQHCNATPNQTKAEMWRKQKTNYEELMFINQKLI